MKFLVAGPCGSVGAALANVDGCLVHKNAVVDLVADLRWEPPER